MVNDVKVEGLSVVATYTIEGDDKAKDPLARIIAAELKSRGLTPTAGARLLGVSQGLVSDLYAGQYRYISVERAARCLKVLGYAVEMSVRRGLERDEGQRA